MTAMPSASEPPPAPAGAASATETVLAGLEARRVTRLARRGVASSERLGRHRRKGERTPAWVLAVRRLTVRYERHAASVQAFRYPCGAASASAGRCSRWASP